MSNVLLIEDDRFLIDDLKAFIEFEGHVCTTYTGPDLVIGEVAGRLARQHRRKHGDRQ